jgi:hypothetical protein
MNACGGPKVGLSSRGSAKKRPPIGFELCEHQPYHCAALREWPSP